MSDYFQIYLDFDKTFISQEADAIYIIPPTFGALEGYIQNFLINYKVLC